MNLNEDQNRVRNTVEDHLKAYLRGEQPQPLLMLVHGPAGTGKTAVVRSLAQLFVAHDSTNLLLKASASDVGAKSLDAVFLNILSLTPALVVGKQYIVIDDCSALSTTVLRELAFLLSKSVGDDGASAMFGSKNVVLVGDVAQYPPSGRFWDTLWWPDSRSVALVKPFFENVVVFKRDMSGKLESWTNLTRRVRTHSTVIGDVDLLNARVCRADGIASMDILSPNDKGIVITTNDTQRQYWNINFAFRFARGARKTLLISPAMDVMVFESGDRLSSDDFDKMKERFKKEFTLLRGVYLFVGMPVTITHSEHRQVWGEVTRIVTDDRDIVEDGRYGVRLKYGVLQATVRVAESCRRANPGLELLVVVTPVMHSFKVNHPWEVNREMVIERTQLPLIPRYAITEEDAMGQTFEKVVLDTSDGFKGYKSPHLVLTRVKRNGDFRMTSTIQGISYSNDEIATQELLDVIATLEGLD